METRLFQKSEPSDRNCARFPIRSSKTLHSDPNFKVYSMTQRLIAPALIALCFLASMAIEAGTLQSPAAAPSTPATVVEFYHAGLDHYFITADKAEANALDKGTFSGWVRTGYQFTGAPSDPSAVKSSPVCRFYGRPDAGLDSHFYSVSPEECAAVIRNYGAEWAYESSNVFRTQMPDLNTGTCPSC
jgi:hypothetical protein